MDSRLSGSEEERVITRFTILVIDEDDLVRDLVCRTISVMGHRPLPVSDIIQAKSECAIKLPDLVILDLSVSGKKGLDFTKWIKKQTHGEMIPLLVLTELGDAGGKILALNTKIAALDEGADDLITKPFLFQELRARLNTLIRARTLSLKLIEKNQLLAEAHEKIVTQERQLCATQLAGAAAHNLGQPLTAMKLNCHLLETLNPQDPKHGQALAAVKNDIVRLTQLLENLRNVNAAKTEEYHSGVKILEVE